MKKALGVCIGLVLVMSSGVAASYSTGFEGPTFVGSAAGTTMTGQDGWYLPSGTDYKVYTYAGNVLGVVDNPAGGDQFAAGTGPGGTIFARAEHAEDWTTDDVWTISYDAAALYGGLPPSANNLGSFSTQPSVGAIGSFVHLFSWVDPTAATNFNAYYLNYDAAGVQVAQPGSIPGPEWSNLVLNHWYRFWTTFDFSSNLITEVGVVDLTTGIETTFSPSGWYLSGGSAGAGAPTINAFRLFAGGSVAGNTVAWDNLVVPEPVTMSLLLLAGLVALRRR